MTLEQELMLSYYKEVATINEDHGIYLVQDIRTGKFYVKKLLTVYNAEIYHYLMDHPIANTPKIYLAGESDGILTVVEEYIPGDTLEEILEEKKTLPEKQVIEITLQLSLILRAFHSCDPAIVNRDIKPSNIKISPDGMVKLLDMNAAKWTNAEAERDTKLLGTQGYAAPEQYGFGPSSVQTDIYALGVLMNVMLTGHFPNSGIPGGRLGRVIRKCVELSPSARYKSIQEVTAALGVIEQAPVEDEKNIGWRRFLPPGYRTTKVRSWFWASCGYILMFWACSVLEVEGAGSLELLLNRLAAMIACVGIVLFNGNYLGIRDKFGITKKMNRIVRWVAIAVVDVALFMIPIILLDMIVSGLGL